MSDEKIKVLIIEDDEMLVNMYAAKFEADGFIVEKALNGRKGIEIAKEVNPDIILLDIMMPEVDGFTVLKELKSETSDIKDKPIVMLTNLGQDEDIEKGTQLGACDYLVKANLTPSQVVTKIKEVLIKYNIKY